MDHGVTAAYIGRGVKTDTWEIRTTGVGKIDDDFGPDIAPIPFKRRKQVDPESITKYCHDNNLDAEKRQDRQTAGNRMRKAEKEKHFASQVYAVEENHASGGGGVHKESQTVSTSHEVLSSETIKSTTSIVSVLQPRSTSQINQGLNQVGLKRKQVEDPEHANLDPFPPPSTFGYR
jgi:hypothetical protein